MISINYWLSVKGGRNVQILNEKKKGWWVEQPKAKANVMNFMLWTHRSNLLHSDDLLERHLPSHGWCSPVLEFQTTRPTTVPLLQYTTLESWSDRKGEWQIIKMRESMLSLCANNFFRLFNGKTKLIIHPGKELSRNISFYNYESL